MSSNLPSEGQYPDPSSEQLNAGSGPFYNQKPDTSQLSSQLSKLQESLDANRGQPPPPPHSHYGGHDQRYAQSGSHVDHNHHPGNQFASQDAAHSAHAAMQGTGNIHEDAIRAAQQSQQASNLAQHMMSLDNADAGSPTSPDDQLPPRAKRNKVSRACDECRRKKIRCDAGETDPAPTCSNCKRTGAPCKFSRTPMKRGPSKGYIKELADKINTLENRLGPPAYGNVAHHLEQGYGETYGPDFDSTENGPERPYEDYAAPHAQMGRKRTHSMSERGGNAANGAPGPWDSHYDERRQSANAWATSDQRQLPSLASTFHNPQTPSSEPSTSGMRRAWSPRTFHRQYGALAQSDRRENGGAVYETERDTAAAALLQWDEMVIDEYYRIIHQTFPLLPHNKSRLRSRLANAPVGVREAFLVALDCCIRSSPYSNLMPGSDLPERPKKASELIAACQYENMTSRTLATDLLYIQTLILMAFETDNHGPATMKGQVGPPRAEWLGRAIGMATHLKLNLMNNSPRLDHGDPDADERLGRRAWWILFILDRWHAISTCCLLQLPENSSSLGPEDQILLGDSTYHLARLSHILGHLTMILTSPTSIMSPTSPATPIISSTILGEISRFRESVESLLLGSPNLVHLCYYHVRLLIHRLTFSTSPTQTTDLQELLIPATRMAGILNQRATGITPLNHHFAALSALTLVELGEFEECRQQAREGLREIGEAIGGRKGLMAREDSVGWDSGIRIVVEGGLRKVEALERGDGGGGGDGQLDGTASGTNAGLRHLADAAVSGHAQAGDGRAETSPSLARDFDPTALTRYGYLAALVREDLAGVAR